MACSCTPEPTSACQSAGTGPKHCHSLILSYAVRLKGRTATAHQPPSPGIHNLMGGGCCSALIQCPLHSRVAPCQCVRCIWCGVCSDYLDAFGVGVCSDYLTGDDMSSPFHRNITRLNERTSAHTHTHTQKK